MQTSCGCNRPYYIIIINKWSDNYSSWKKKISSEWKWKLLPTEMEVLGLWLINTFHYAPNTNHPCIHNICHLLQHFCWLMLVCLPANALRFHRSYDLQQINCVFSFFFFLFFVFVFFFRVCCWVKPQLGGPMGYYKPIKTTARGWRRGKPTFEERTKTIRPNRPMRPKRIWPSPQCVGPRHCSPKLTRPCRSMCWILWNPQSHCSYC